jgi:hypothetical protein
MLSVTKRSRYTLLMAAAGLLAQPAGGQAAERTFLSAICESVKPGQMIAHDQHEARWARAVEKAKGFTPALAVQSTTGPAVTCWLSLANSYDQVGKSYESLMADAAYAKALPSLLSGDAPFVSDTRSFIAVLRPDLSSGAIPDFLTRRVMEWGEWRVRFGTEQYFEAAVKTYRAAAIRAGAEPSFRVWRVRQGAPSATYWIMSSQDGMAGFDKAMAMEEKIGSAYTAEDLKVFDEATSKSNIFHTSHLWSYSPTQSALTAEQRASGPFWKLMTPSAKP